MQWFIWEYVAVGVYFISSEAAGWHTGLDKGDFRCWTPLANICPSGTSPPQSIRDSFAQPPKAWQEKASRRSLVCISAFLVLAERDRTYSVNVVLWAESYRRRQQCKSLFFLSLSLSVWQAMNLCNWNWTVHTLYFLFMRAQGLGVSHESWAVTVNQGLSPR